MFPTVIVNVDQQLFGYPHSSKYLLTDVNVCGAVQYIDTAAPELQLIECALYQDTTIFLQKQIVETFFIVHDIVHIAQTGPQGHFSVGPQRGRGSSPPGTPLVTSYVHILKKYTKY